MDQKELQEKIALYYSKLPPEAQEVFSSMAWLETLKKISVKYGLNDKQIETLGTETTLVLLGIIHLVEYEENLTNELRLSRDSTDKMLLEIEDSILKTVRPQLVQAYEANTKEEVEEEGTDVGQPEDKRLSSLPEEIESIVRESNYQSALYYISKEYNLNVEQMGVLEMDVTNLIIGAIRPNDFEDIVEDSLNLGGEKTRELVKQINERIFLPIRKKMMERSSKEPLVKTLDQVRPISIDQEKHDTGILSSAGIELLDRKEIKKEIPPEITAPVTQPLPVQKSEPIKLVEEKLELEADKHPILTQKLSGIVKNDVVETEHTIENIAKNYNDPVLGSAVEVTPKSSYTVDPYRMKPE